MQFFNDKDFNGCWCIRTISEIPKDNQRVKSEIQLQKKLFIDLIKKIISTNKLREDDHAVHMLAKHVYLLYESAVSESHLHQEQWPIVTAKQMCEKMVA